MAVTSRTGKQEEDSTDVGGHGLPRPFLDCRRFLGGSGMLLAVSVPSGRLAGSWGGGVTAPVVQESVPE